MEGVDLWKVLVGEISPTFIVYRLCPKSDEIDCDFEGDAKLM